MMGSVRVALPSELLLPTMSWALHCPSPLEEIAVSSGSSFESKRAPWEINHSIDDLPDTKMLRKKYHKRILIEQRDGELMGLWISVTAVR